MGTNYYIDTSAPCGGKCAQHCRDAEIHLGKSSAGWSFTFRAYPDPDTAPEIITWPITDYASWLKLLDLGDIRDEYHAPITREELLDLIQSKRGGRSTVHGHDFLDSDGNRFISGEFS